MLILFISSIDQDIAIFFVFNIGVLDRTILVYDESIIYLNEFSGFILFKARNLNRLILIIFSSYKMPLIVQLVILVTSDTNTLLLITGKVSPLSSLIDWDPVFMEPSSDPPK